MKLYNVGYLLKEGFRNLKSNRTMTIASVAVLVSCLILTGAATLFSMNIGQAMEMIEGNNSITVYLKEDMPTLESVQVGEELRKVDNVATCDFVPKDEALKSMMEMLGDDGTVLEGLTGSENFLPDAYDISMTDLTKYDETIANIKKVDGVDHITDYSDIADKLNSLDSLVNMVGFWVVLLLGIVSLFIIANTVRVTMYSRRMEISIMKSVGATNWFVRWPFVVEGVVIGLIAGALASILLFVLYNSVMQVISGIAAFFTPIAMNELLLPYTLGFMLAGAAFGALGGIISIGKYLRKGGSELVAL